MRAFKPQLVPTIFTICALVVLLSLGTWQVKRLVFKNTLVADIHQQVAKPILDFLPDETDLSETKFRRLRLSGRFLHDKEMHFYSGPKVIKGKPGYNVITPLELISGDIILVDRGWVPQIKKEQGERPESLVAGANVDVVGMLHNGHKPGWFSFDNDPVKNVWLWIDVVGFTKHHGLTSSDFYLRELKGYTNGDDGFIKGEPKVELRNDHLQYAITWYSLAIIALVIYVLFHLRGGRDKELEETN